MVRVLFCFFVLRFIYFSFVCMIILSAERYVHHECAVLEEARRVPETGVTNSCVMLEMEPRSHARVPSALNG